MHSPIDFYDSVAIATVVVYSFFLIGGVYLCFKHGFAKSSGWRFLIILALARLIGSSLRLATINDPTNQNLYIGWEVLNGLGLGPLVAMLLGLLTRVFESINYNRRGNFIFQPRYQRLPELIMLVGLILVIVGGTESNFTVVNGQPTVQYASLSTAGIAIFVAITGILILELILAVANRIYIDRGENRILLAIIACLPFLIVRLVYVCIEVFGKVTANKWMYLFMFVIMEMIIVLICEVLGFTLDKKQLRAVEPQPESRWGYGDLSSIRGVRQIPRKFFDMRSSRY